MASDQGRGCGKKAARGTHALSCWAALLGLILSRLEAVSKDEPTATPSPVSPNSPGPRAWHGALDDAISCPLAHPQLCLCVTPTQGHRVSSAPGGSTPGVAAVLRGTGQGTSRGMAASVGRAGLRPNGTQGVFVYGSSTAGSARRGGVQPGERDSVRLESV